MVTVVTLAIRENGSKIAYFSHSTGTAHGAPPKTANNKLYGGVPGDPWQEEQQAIPCWCLFCGKGICSLR